MSTEAKEPTLRVLALGAGVQSTTLLLLAAEGKLPKPDVAIFSDTGWEPREVYAHLDRLDRQVAQPAGIPILRVQHGDLRAASLDPERRITMPVFVATRDGGSAPASIRECTRDYKIRPITRAVRELIGYPGRKRVPRSVFVEQWIGFSTDEYLRMSGKSDARFIRTIYPFIDLDMDRAACRRYLAARGWGETPKSACVGCPFHGNAAWRRLRNEHPEEWADAVEFDRSLRERPKKVGLRGDPYLHRSLLPLDEAPIDRVSRREWDDRQVDLLDLIAEEGEPDGCGPFSCHSGGAA